MAGPRSPVTDDDPRQYRVRLVEKLADSLAGAIPSATPRRIHGAVALRGKATAVTGMRRAGKTTFLHQIRRERLARGVPRERSSRCSIARGERTPAMPSRQPS
jgi:hypothetical protein